jgi:uncharacterized protein (TIGR03086 family)
MSDLSNLYARSIGRFAQRVANVPDDGWSAPTPCADWDVRQLVNHVTYEQVWAPHMVAGDTIEAVGDRYDGDLLGDDPVHAHRSAVAVAVEAFADADLDATVHVSYGDIPLREYLTQMLTDAEVHGWDLAVATGQDPAIDPEVAELLLGVWIEQEELVRASGVFGDAVEVPADASAADRLLGLLGRQPGGDGARA